MRAPHNTSCSHSYITSQPGVMLPTALCWFLGALLLVVGVVASLYLLWLQTHRGVTTFSLLATSDALATIAVSIAFLINAAHNQNSDARMSMPPSECSHGQLTLASALFLAPFVNTFVSMIVYSAESLQSAQSRAVARSNPRLVSSIAAQWIVPAISTILLFSAGIQQSRPYRSNASDTCMEGTALTPIPVESMEECLHQEDISNYITSLMNTRNFTTKHLNINNTQSTDKEVTEVVNNVYKILQSHRIRRSPNNNQLPLSILKGNFKTIHEFNKWKAEMSKFENKKNKNSAKHEPESSPLHRKSKTSQLHYLQSKQPLSLLVIQPLPNIEQMMTAMHRVKVHNKQNYVNNNPEKFQRVPELTASSQTDYSPSHLGITLSNLKSQRRPRSAQLESTPEDTAYYDTTNEYDKEEDEELTSAPEEPTTEFPQPSDEHEAMEMNVNNSSQTPAVVTTETPEMTTYKETGLIEIQIPDTVNMCVVKCHLSNTFLKKYLFVLLFLCYFIPIIASLTMYFSTPSTHPITEVKPSTAEESCNMQSSTTLPVTMTVKHSILSSVLMWSPTLIETLLRAWLCVSTPQWLTMLLFVLAQAHALVRNSINLRLVRKRACSGSIQPLAENEEMPAKLFTKVKQAILN